MVKGLKFTSDLPENHESGKCPMLDFQVWAQEIGGNLQIRHTFYQKATTSPLVFHAKGDHIWRSKLVTLDEEVRRRLRNMDTRHSNEEKLEVIRDSFRR